MNRRLHTQTLRQMKLLRALMGSTFRERERELTQGFLPPRHNCDLLPHHSLINTGLSALGMQAVLPVLPNRGNKGESCRELPQAMHLVSGRGIKSHIELPENELIMT